MVAAILKQLAKKKVLDKAKVNLDEVADKVKAAEEGTELTPRFIVSPGLILLGIFCCPLVLMILAKSTADASNSNC